MHWTLNASPLLGSSVGFLTGWLDIASTMYHLQGQLDRALDYLEGALALFGQMDNPAFIALSLYNIGSIYQRQGQLDRALDFFQRVLTLNEHVENPAIIRGFNNIGMIYQRQGQLEAALNYFKGALALYDEQVGDLAYIARSCHNIAFLFSKQEQWYGAIRLFLIVSYSF